LPSKLGELVSLKTIDLSQNLIEGTIPLEIAALPHLEKLSLSHNSLTGLVPPFASRLLREVNLSGNNLFGSLPSDIGQRHERLETLDLSDNSMHGKIPESIGLMKNLETLTLSDNNFSGTIPGALGDTKLSYLYLNDNWLVGRIPPELVGPSSKLMEVWLEDNSLSGTIPASIASMPDLYDFYIDGNKFTGTIPEDMCTENLNKDFFESAGDNEDHNFCDAIACGVGEYAEDGIYPCIPCEEGTKSPYLGTYESCYETDQASILDMLYDYMKGEDWNGPNVQGWGTDTDYCGWGGVTCDEYGNVIELNLKGMNMQGELIEEIGFLSYLTSLDISDNRLTGVVPSDLRWAPLTKLDISGNLLAGEIAPALCHKEGINKNGDSGDFNCDHIACAVGSYSETGFAMQRGDCKPCSTGKLLGQKSCEAAVEGEEGHGAPWLSMPGVPKIDKATVDDLSGSDIAGIVFGVLFVVVALFGSIAIYLRSGRRDRAADPTPEEQEAMTARINPDVEFT
jgi:Leucine-rich repeat (LRR) protein